MQILSAMARWPEAVDLWLWPKTLHDILDILLLVCWYVWLTLLTSTASVWRTLAAPRCVVGCYSQVCSLYSKWFTNKCTFSGCLASTFPTPQPNTTTVSLMTKKHWVALVLHGLKSQQMVRKVSLMQFSSGANWFRCSWVNLSLSVVWSEHLVREYLICCPATMLHIAH